VPELQRLHPGHAPEVLAFELANRSYFAAFISDRGDAYFSQFAQQHSALLAEQEAGAGAYYVLVAEDGSVLGRFNLYRFCGGTAELGYRVAQHAAGRGLATATVRELVRLAAARHGLRTVRAATTLDNTASQKVLTKAGFIPVGPADPAHIGGRQGTWYQRDLTAADAAGPPPPRLPAVCRSWDRRPVPAGRHRLRLHSNRIIVPKLCGTLMCFFSAVRREVPVPTASQSSGAPPRSKRADALRNEQALLAAAAAVFVASGVDAPIREIAARAGVGIGTIYRHFPTRADLIVAVFRHQVEACAEAGPILLASAGSPLAALRQWIDLFVDFLVTKHGLANALQSDDGGFETLHAYFLDRLVPVCGQLLDAAVSAREVRTGLSAYELMRGIGSLCARRDNDPRYDPRRLIELLLLGLQRPPSADAAPDRVSGALR
jgi:AcrR family transcriptional regulator/RimJ/RimL family protein N-acetyltransferase